MSKERKQWILAIAILIILILVIDWLANNQHYH